MAQRARRTRKRNTKKGGKVKVVIISIVAIALAVTAVFAATHFYKTTENNLEKSAYPLEYTDLVNKAAKEYNLQPALIYGVIHTESRFNPDAGSSVGAVGLMQIMPETFDWLQEKRGEAGKYTTEDLYTPSVNIDYGSYLLRYFLDYYGNEKCAVAAYNAGFEVSNWLEDPNCSPDGMTLDVIPYPETSEYVVKVENAKQKYIELYFS
ncbi:lytic transglycosylase domain-containing protein [Ruminococcus sp. JL13D9]|uniref:lytic transglycosylase domain-containing protein n=1 Tax=Ruminococcus sp. JL13D9 TaxID=3233381 RepID=UPI00389A82CB